MNMTLPPDTFAQQTKKMTAATNRLRGWVGTDASKSVELADALVALTAHRLLAHQFTDAAADAQQSLSLAAKLLAAHGPLGPYTPAHDASRVIVAAVHLATIQAEAGQTDGAATTLTTVDAIRAGAASNGLVLEQPAEVATWEKIIRSRIALAGGDARSANELIDAAAEGREFQELDRLQTIAGARWAAGAVSASVAAAWRALERYEKDYLPTVLDRGIAPARLVRIGQPLIGIYSDLADRLAASGEMDTALAIRRSLVGHLETLTDSHGARWRTELATARRWLAADLVRAGRDAEAGELLARAEVRSAPVRPELERAEELVDWDGAKTDRSELPASAAEIRAAATDQEMQRKEAAERRRLELLEEQAAAERQRAEQPDESADVDTDAAERPGGGQAAATGSPSQRAERMAAHEEAQRQREAELRAAAAQAVDELQAARAHLAAARVAGDRQGVFASAKTVVVELRARFTADPGVAGELIEALKELAAAQRACGDWWGSRKPAKEARDLAKRWRQ